MWVVIGIIFVSVAALAQEFRATIAGSVSDPSGAAVPGAIIVAVHEPTGVSRQVAANDSGDFQIPYVQPGAYTVNAEASGFKKLQRRGLEVLVGQRLELRLVLELGQANESVTVTAEVPILDTGSADLGTIVDQSYMDRQPISGRNVMAMISFAPGIVGTLGNYVSSAQKDYTINGGGGTSGSNEVVVDGLSVVLPKGTLGNVPTTEAVQEFRVHTTMFDAALSRSTGGAVSIATRGGTNELHGSFYNYWRPSALRANSWANNRNGLELANPAFTLAGGTAGGPVVIPKVYNGRNRTFFFFSLERDSEARSYTRQARVPTSLERQGDFSQTLNSRGTALAIYDPATTLVEGSRATRQAFPGAKIPASRFDQTGAAVMQLYETPSLQVPAQISAYNWARTTPYDTWEKNIGMRIDHSFSDRYRLMGRFGLMRFQTDPRDIPAGAYAITSTSDGLNVRDLRFRSVTINQDYTVSPSTVLNLRLGYIRYYNTSVFESPDVSQMKLASVIVQNQAVSGWSTINTGENGMILGYNQSASSTDTYSLSASATRLVAKHGFTAGGEWRVGRANSRSPGSSASGSFTFNNTFTRSDPFTSSTGNTSGTAMASLLLGLPASGSLGYSASLATLNHSYALYLKDDWKLTPWLTLNLGLRWELETPSTERYDRLTYDFDRTAKVPVTVPGMQIVGGLRFVNQDGLSRYQGRFDRNNFGPRFGFAAELDKNTVLRGGYGIFYAVNSGNQATVASFNAVTSMVATIDGGATPYATLANPFPNGLVQPVGRANGLTTELGKSISFYESGRVLPYTQQWQLSLQRQLPWLLRLQVAYVGMLSLKQYESFNLNEIPDSYRVLGAAQNIRVTNPFYGVLPDTTTVGASSTIAQSQFWVAYPQFSSVTADDSNTGRAIYHGMQTSFEKRFARGLSFMWNYTWSKLIDNNTTSLVNDRHWYRTVSTLDRTHVARFIVNWDLPFGPGKLVGGSAGRVWGRVIGGWSLSGRWTYDGGTPLSITDTNGRPIRISNPSLGGSVSDRLGDRRDPVTGVVQNPYFDINAFRSLSSQYEVAPEPPVFAELRSPPARRIDAVLSKEARIRERIRAGFRFEVYALANSPNFSSPGTSMTNRSTFGVITAVGISGTAGQVVGVDGARVVQIALEVKF